MSSVIGALSFWTLALAAVMVETIGPKMTSWLGIFFKILACLLFAVGDPSTCSTCYPAFLFFSTSSSFILMSVIPIFTYFTKISLTINTLISIFFTSGGWIYFFIFNFINTATWRIGFFIYGGFFGLVLLVTIFFWPIAKLSKNPAGGEPIPKERVRVSRRLVRRIVRAGMRWDYCFILFFVIVICLKSNLLLYSITQQLYYLTNDFDLIQEYHTSGSLILSTISLLPILLSYLGEKFPNTDIYIILFFAILNSALSLIPLAPLQIVRFIATGIYYPYALAFAISFFIKGKKPIGWEHFGYLWGGLMVLCGVLLFGLVAVSTTDAPQGVMWSVNVFFLVWTLMLLGYPVGRYARKVWRRRKRMRRV
eukprot:TRINITY_DN1111_c0_g1_i1.p1 TRINITY_DN1111_c0_g1~~TRINITY_DN1111_c0_g1_i1.p1  ORF type:complete len:366 (+),score=86.71 TRINITY_DN1111_c0_g1_i1:526-1623(+)